MQPSNKSSIRDWLHPRSLHKPHKITQFLKKIILQGSEVGEPWVGLAISLLIRRCWLVPRDAIIEARNKSYKTPRTDGENKRINKTKRKKKKAKH